MAIIRKSTKAPEEQHSSLGDLLSELINKNSDGNSRDKDDKRNPNNWVDIVEFCESPYFLGLTPFPWQKLILKLFYMGSEGNHNLEISSAPSGCKNCIWDKNKLRGFDPCLKCTECSAEEFDKRILEIEDKMYLDEDEIIQLKENPKTNMFMNETMLIQQDLIEDSDANDGGSVKRQVTSKIGKSFSELLLVLGRRSGKMLCLETPIITPDGWKTMKDINVGDYVFGPDGFPTKVIAESPIEYNPNCYEITFSNGEKILADAQHEWVTLTKAQRKNEGRGASSKKAIPQIFTTEEIKDSLYVGKERVIYKDKKPHICKHEHNHCIEITKPLQYGKKDLPIDPYILGLWVGDGTANNGEVTGIDMEIFDYVESLGYTCQHYPNYDKKHRIVLCPNGEKFISVLKRSNLIKNKHIPQIYLQSSVEDRLELLRGLLDSDGYCDPKKHSVEFCSCNELIAKQTYELICGLGFKAVMKKSDAKLYGRKTSDRYRISFMPTTNVPVFNLHRKLLNQANKNKSDINRVWITNVEKHDTVPMKCIQVNNESHQYLCGESMIPTHNSMIVSIIALYESYKLIEMGNPQAKFGNLNEGDTICILNVAVSEQQAKESVFDKIKPMIVNSGYFRTKISPASLQNRSVRFLTPRDEEINQQLNDEGLPSREGSIYLLSGHSNSDSLVGKNVLVVIIDEMASMVGKDGSKMSDEELYTKLKHSIWTFGKKGKIICISNPLTKDGKFFELYDQSFTDDRILMVQLPSYKVNPTLDQKALDAERDAAQKAGQYEQYQMQIEARFSGGAAQPFIPPEFIDEALQKGSQRRRAERGNPNLLYYMHLDPANNSDNYALAIVHVEEDPLILDANKKPSKILIVDHINMWEPSKTGEPVNIADVDEYVIRMTRCFNIVSISYDMWESAASSQLLKRMGLPARITPFSSSYKQQIYSTLRNLFFEGRIEFYGSDGYDPSRMTDCYGFVQETVDQFKFLGKKFNRSSFSVSAAAGHYDDIPDCIAGASFIALTNQQGYVTLPRMGSVRMTGFR